MRAKLEGFKMNVSVNVKVECDYAKTDHNKFYKNEKRNNFEEFKNLALSAGADMDLSCNNYEGEVNLKELTEVIKMSISDSINDQINNQMEQIRKDTSKEIDEFKKDMYDHINNEVKKASKPDRAKEY